MGERSDARARPVVEGDREFEALREAIDAFAQERAPELVAEARAEALVKVRSMLSDAIAQSLLAPATPYPGADPRGDTTAPPPHPRAPQKRPRTAPPADPPSDADGWYVYGVV